MTTGKVAQGFRLYLRLAAASLQARMEYKLNFALTTFLYGILSVVDMVLIAALLTRFRTVGGWSLAEVALLYGLSSAAMGIFRTFAPEVDNFERYIVQGEFDGLLLRPWPSLFVLLTRNVDIWRIGWAMQGYLVATVAALALIRSDSMAPWALGYLWLLPLAGCGIFFALALVTAALAFWVERINELQVFTLHAPQNASGYPLHIYPRWLRWLFSSAVPVAFVNYVPVRYLLGKGGSGLDLFVSPMVAAIALWVAYRFWCWGESRYQSTGS